MNTPSPQPSPEGRGSKSFSAFLWLALPAVASLLLMAVTNTICQDAAVVPFLWVLPLAIYLLSFIIAFDSPRWYARSLFIPLTFIAIAASCWAILGRDEQQLGLEAQIAIHCAALAMTCMVCHGELYRLRPPPENLTAFYLAIAAGGAVGGLLVALVAPRVLHSYAELQLGFGAALLLTILVLYVDPGSVLSRGHHFFAWLGVWVAAALVMMLLYATAGESGAGRGSVAIERTRNFFGVLSVYERSADDPVQQLRVLQHGGVTHGKQFVLPTRRATPTSYYTPDSGAGLLLRAFPKSSDRRIAIVGLGVGTLVAYAREGDTFIGYEINPEVVRLARQHFTYLSDTSASVRIVLGDGRLSMAREPRDTMFDVLVLDAFSGDAIPVHLLTEQAFALYLDHLDSAGAIAVHISNHHLNLLPVLTKLAERFDLEVAQFLTDANEAMAGDASHWVVLTRRANRSLLEIPLLKDAAEPIRIESRLANLPLWTDDYTALVPLLR